MTARPQSLRRAFLKQVAIPLIVCSALVWLAGLAYIYHEVDEVYDATLAQFAKEIDQLTQKKSSGGASKEDGEKKIQHKYERKISFRIAHKGKIIAQSAFTENMGPGPEKTGFYNREIDGERWRFFIYRKQASGVTVEVAEKYEIRYEMIVQLLGSLVVPAILFLVSVLFVVWWGATRSLRRVVALSAQMDARDVNDMTPVEDASIPQEVQPLLDALNRLFSRVSEGLRREREFSDNAAHELRTPLAAIKTQAQVLAKSEKMGEECKAGLANLLASIDRAAGMVDSLLTFTRLQSDKEEVRMIDFSALVGDEMKEILRFSVWKNRKIETNIQPGVSIRGSAQGLAIMVRNIVMNALKFSPETGHIAVTLSDSRDSVRFVVADTGPGIPDTLKDKVFDRFFKGKKSNSAGSGLGLSMVKWVADAHGAEIILTDNAPSGLTFEVRFPSAR